MHVTASSQLAWYLLLNAVDVAQEHATDVCVHAWQTLQQLHPWNKLEVHQQGYSLYIYMYIYIHVVIVMAASKQSIYEASLLTTKN